MKPSCTKNHQKMSHQISRQRGYIKWGLGLCSAGAMLGALLVGGESLSAKDMGLGELKIVNNELQREFGGSDRQGDALDVAAVETPEALKSVMLSAAYAGERMVVVGERGHILYSDDRGKSWSQAPVPVRSTLTSVFFISPKKGWAVGHDTVILTTEDGGLSWTKILDGNQANQIVLQSAQERLDRIDSELANATGAEKGLLRNKRDFAEMALDEADRDAGVGPNKTLMDIWFADEHTGIAVGAAGYMLRTTDGGESWKDWSGAIASQDFFHLYKLAANKNGYLFLVGEAAQVYRSSDKGLSWEALPVPYEGSFFGALGKDSDDSVYIFGMSGVVLKSLDNGDSWKQVDSNTRSILQNATVIDGDRVAIVGLGGGLLVEDAKAGVFTPQKLGTRAAFTAVLVGENQQLLAAGETGLRLYDAATKNDDGSLQSVESLHFMFNKRDNQ